MFKNTSGRLIESNIKPEILILPLDFDGCTDSKEGREYLKKFILSFIQENPHYKKIILCIFSLRQSVWIDFVNAFKNANFKYGSCSILAEDFFSELKEELALLDIALSFESILTHDVYNKLKPGSTFLAMNKINYRQCLQFRRPSNLVINNEEDTPVTMFAWTGSRPDLSESKMAEHSCQNKDKTDICYMFMHYFAKQLGSQRYTILVIDDLVSVLSNAETYFASHAGLIPDTCLFHGIQHFPFEKKYYPDSYKTSLIQGRGQLNPNFAEDMIRIRQQSLNASCDIYQTNFAHHLSMLDKVLIQANEIESKSMGSNTPESVLGKQAFFQISLPPLSSADLNSACSDVPGSASRKET